MQMRKKPFALLLIALFLLTAGFAFPQGNEPNQGEGEAVVTVLPPREGAGSPAVAENQLNLKVNGKPADISKWERLQGSDAPVQLIVLIDDGARGSLGNQLHDIAQLFQRLPPSAEVGVAYMVNGRAEMAGALTKDHSAAARELRVPKGQPGISGSPYFCLSDLAHHWPSRDTTARRVAVMITNGVDNYDPATIRRTLMSRRRFMTQFDRGFPCTPSTGAARASAAEGMPPTTGRTCWPR